MVTDGDVDVAAEPSQQTHQALDRHIAKLPVEQPRHVRLTQAHAFGRRDLGQFLRGNDPLNAGHQFRFKHMGFGIGECYRRAGVSPDR